jgi:hypothetical protein
MNEKQLGKMLLERGDATAMTDPVALARQIVERDRTRLRWLAACVLILWFVAVPLAGWAAWYFAAEHVEDVVRDVQRVLESIVKAGQLELSPGDRIRLEDLKESYDRDIYESTFAIAGLTAAFLLAGMLGLRYVHRSRQVTLREINANLLDISEQLKQLRQGPQA